MGYKQFSSMIVYRPFVNLQISADTEDREDYKTITILNLCGARVTNFRNATFR